MKLLRESSPLKPKNLPPGIREWARDTFHLKGSDWFATFLVNLFNLCTIFLLSLLLVLGIGLYREVTESPEEAQEGRERFHAKICSGEEYREMSREWFLENCNARIDPKGPR